jgi:hypothetical protein
VSPYYYAECHHAECYHADSRVAAGTHLNRIKVMKKNSLKSIVISGQYYKLFTATSGVFLYDFD